MEEETLDEILNGRISVYQNKKGYRFSVDAMLLAHFIALKPHVKTIELGCGNGVILLILAKRFPQLKFTGLEIQDRLVLLAQRNVQLNRLENNVDVIGGDAQNIKKIFPPNTFDVVYFNPPYRKMNSGRMNPHPEKAIARHEIKGSLEVFLKASQHLLKETGSVFAIYPAKRLVELVCLFRQNKIEPKRLKVVFSDKASDATLILVEGKKGSGEELRTEPPLFIYEGDHHYSRETLKIFHELSVVPAGGGD
jgi:tRNA1Val (adenine37-N6)-methyltransferase